MDIIRPVVSIIWTNHSKAVWRQTFHSISWWRHQMETLSALLALCAGNSPVSGEFPSQRPVMRSFDVLFDLCLNKQLRKQWKGWWFETPSRSLWRQSNRVMIGSDNLHWLVVYLTPKLCLTIYGHFDWTLKYKFQSSLESKYEHFRWLKMAFRFSGTTEIIGQSHWSGKLIVAEVVLKWIALLTLFGQPSCAVRAKAGTSVGCW